MEKWHKNSEQNGKQNFAEKDNAKSALIFSSTVEIVAECVLAVNFTSLVK